MTKTGLSRLILERRPWKGNIMSDAMVCPWWLAYTFDHPLRRRFHRAERIFGPYIRPGATAYDLGCGMGFNTLGLARLVGPNGHVIAVDVQEKMLQVLMKRAVKASLDDRISSLTAEPHRLGLDTPADFSLAFWMLHETPDPPGFIEEVSNHLCRGGRFMIVEPKFHVSKKLFRETIDLCRSLGLNALDEPQVRLSRAVVFQKD
jgi:ubiquinone/menaquinone biosynthesis C-methylase UbiE